MTLTASQWRRRTDWNEVCRRAAGRRKYNLERRRWAAERETVVFQLLLEYGLWEWGTLSRIARELSVSRATICRDRQRILRSMLA
jgi:hypothetical protein